MAERVVVIDNGGGTLKAGYADEDGPLCVMPNCAVRVQKSAKVYVGDELLRARAAHEASGRAGAFRKGLCDVSWWKRAHERGQVTDWKVEKRVWERALATCAAVRDAGLSPSPLSWSEATTTEELLESVVESLTNASVVKSLSLSSSLTRDQERARDMERASSTLVFTEAPLSIPTLSDVAHEVAFEEFSFGSVYRCSPSSLALYEHQRNHLSDSGGMTTNVTANVTTNVTGKQRPQRSELPPCALVVDSGHSSTHLSPFFDGTLLNYAVRRINVGGKLLTNYLKEAVSYRQWNMMDQTHLMNHIKERLCFVSLNFLSDMEKAKRTSTLRRRYVLPDFVHSNTGYLESERPDGVVVDEEQILTMNNETIAVPELLFQPSAVGLPQAGVAEAIVQAVELTPVEMHECLYGNILLVGGNTLFPNFQERLHKDLRSLMPTQYSLNITRATDPILAAWSGGAALARHEPEALAQMAVTQAEYQEHGHRICHLKFTN